MKTIGTLLILSLASQGFAYSPTVKTKPITTKVVSPAPQIVSKMKLKKPRLASTLRLIPMIGGGGFTYTGEDSEYFQYSTRFNGGLLLDIGREYLVFETGLQYFQMGFELSAESELSSVKLSQRTDYLAIPLIGKARMSMSSFRPYMRAGLVPAFLISTEGRFQTNSKGAAPSASIEQIATLQNINSTSYTRDGLNDFVLLGVIGLGAEINMGKGAALILDAAYNRGLSPAFKYSKMYDQGFTGFGGVAIDL